MILTKKIRLKPTKDQERMFWQHAGAARWAYNMAHAEAERMAASQKDLSPDQRIMFKSSDYNKFFITNIKKTPEYAWLNEIGSHAVTDEIRFYQKARIKYFMTRESGQQFGFRKKGKTPEGFFVPNNKIRQYGRKIQIQKIGRVTASETLPKSKIQVVRITYDHKYWYLCVSYEIYPTKISPKTGSLGIDLGIKELVTCSDGTVYININKTQTVKKLNKKIKRYHRKLSKRARLNTNFRDGKNFYKVKHKLQLLYRRLTNIRNNHIRQSISAIVKTKPSQIVIEDLKVMNMLKNKRLAKMIQSQKFYDFKRILIYKCQMLGIPLVIADRWFPSSKTCSKCGHINHDLRLKDRTYRCTHCGLVLDRDLNAAINLSNYEVST